MVIYFSLIKGVVNFPYFDYGYDELSSSFVVIFPFPILDIGREFLF